MIRDEGIPTSYWMPHVGSEDRADFTVKPCEPDCQTIRGVQGAPLMVDDMTKGELIEEAVARRVIIDDLEDKLDRIPRWVKQFFLWLP